MASPKKTNKGKVVKQKKKNIVSGFAHIHSTYQNTIVSFSDLSGAVFAWSSSGAIGYKGTKKKTPYAAGLAASAAVENAKSHGLKEVKIFIKGIGPGKDTARKQIENSGLVVKGIEDITPIPFNGTRPPKRILKRRKK